MSDELPRLLVDGMLGRLAKWLRLLGYDTVYDNAASDPELARRSRAEGRILVTRDRELSARRGLRTLLIRSEKLEEQVEEVRDAFASPSPTPLSRCAVCNAELETVSPADVVSLVPPYVLKTQSEFRRCPGCGRVYWPGTHLEEMQKQMKEFPPAERAEGTGATERNQEQDPDDD
jgi:uncharacterized protein with PIN domain